MLRRTRGGMLLVVLLLLGSCSPSAPASSPQPSKPAPQPAAASAPAPSATVSTATPPPAPLTLRYGQVALVAQFWPIYVAEAQEFFTAEGVTLDNTVFRVSSDATRALSGDSLDIVGTATDSAILATEQGADTISVSGVLNKPVYSLVVRPDVRGYADLRGKTLGVSDLKDGSTILLQRMLEREGLRPDAYDVVQTGGTPDRYAALKSGAIAATMLSQPNDFQAVAEGYPSLVLVSDVIPDYQFTSNVVRRNWAQANEPALARFHRAYARACQWLYDPGNKNEAVRILVDKLKTTDELARKTYDVYMEHAQAMPRAGELNLAGVRTVMDIMGEIGNLPRPLPPLERFVDTGYLERALR